MTYFDTEMLAALNHYRTVAQEHWGIKISGKENGKLFRQAAKILNTPESDTIGLSPDDLIAAAQLIELHYPTPPSN